MPMGKAMREAGYSPSYSENPKQLTSTLAWQEFIQEALPEEISDWELLQKHKELIYCDDMRMVAWALDRMYRLKGKYNRNSVR